MENKEQFELLEEEYGVEDGEALYHYCDNFHIALKDVDQDIINQFKDSFEGRYSSLEEYAQILTEETGMMQDTSFLSRYFDYKKFAHDLVMSGDIWSEESYGEVLVYVSR